MLFSSFTFIFVFLPIVWVAFHLLKKARFKSHYTIAKIFLIASSLFFYAFWKVAYLPILLSSIIVNYTLAKMILKNSTSLVVLKSSATNGGGNHYLDSSASRDSNADVSSLRGVANAEAIHKKEIDFQTDRLVHNDKIMDCHESLRDSRNDEHNVSCYKSHNNSIRFTPKFYFILGIIFNLCLLGFFKYTDFLLENFNAFSKLAHLDFDIPLPHILLPLALSFVTFQQIAFLFDCYKRTKGELNENLHIDFVDYALFISFFPQLIAGPIVHHREMMPQFAKMSNSSSGNHCADLPDFESSQTFKSSSLPKSSKNSTSTTANTRIVESTNPSLRENERSEFSWQSTSKSVESSLQGARSEASATKQSISKNKIDCHDSTLTEWNRGNDEMESTHSKNSPSLAEGVRGWVDSTINYEFLAKGIFIFSIGLFKKVFIADSFAKWANAGFAVVEKGGFLNTLESWATSLSYTFQLYFDFSGYCDMAMGLALMFGIVLPLNFDSPYKSLNIAEFWRRWHITLGRFLKECLYIPLGGNRVSKILNLRNLFTVAFLSGIWHGAGWGFVIWGVLHGVAMVIHRIYSWWLDSIANRNNSSLRENERSEFSWQSKPRESNQAKDAMSQKRINESHKFTQSKQITNDSKVAKMDSSLHALRSAQNDKKLIFTQTKLYKFLCWFITFNFINIAWIFFRSENLNGAMNLIKGMFGVVWVELPQKLHRMPEVLAQIGGRNDTIFYIIIAFIVCVVCKNSFEMLKGFDTQHLRFRLALRIFSKNIYLKGGAVFTRFVLTIALFYIAIWAMLSNLLDSNAYTPFLYFNF